MAAIITDQKSKSFVAPYGRGIAKDASGSFQPALIAFSVVGLLTSSLLRLRHQLRREASQPGIVLSGLT